MAYATLSALSAILLLASLPGCQRRPSANGAASRLRVQLSAEPVTLDPGRAEDGVSFLVLSNTMEGLVGYGPDGKLGPRLAESWSVSPDGRRYVFQLSKSAKWSDGRPVLAGDFVAALRRVTAKDSLSKLAPIFSPIRDVHEEHGALVIELRESAPYFIQALTLPQAMPIRADLLAGNGGRWKDDFPVTGPYRITEHAIERRILLERNPFFRKPAQLPEIEIDVVPDESTALHLFEKGELDILMKLPEADFARLKAQGVIRTSPFCATYFLAFNVKKPPFDRAENRRAFAASVRKGEIATILGTDELPAESWIPLGIEGYVPFPSRSGDSRSSLHRALSPGELAQARRAFTQAGKIVFRFDASARNRLIAEKLEQDLLSGLGLKLSLENMDWKSYIRSLQTDAPSVFRFGWLAPFDDPITHLRVFTTGNPNNYGHFSDPRYDALVDRIAGLAPGALRDEKLRQAQEILIGEDAAVVPVYHYVQNHAVSARVSGFNASPFGVIHFEDLGLQSPH